MFTSRKISKIFVVFCLAALGGYLFQEIGLFLPWLLGPMFIVMFSKIKLGDRMYWPATLRNLGLVILGLQMGSSFTKPALNQMIHYLPLMLFTTIAIIIFTVLTSLFISKRMNITLNTALLGSFPGGLSQMVILGEEIKDADETLIAFMQTFRIILVVLLVPWVVIHRLTDLSGTKTGVNLDQAGHFFILQYDWKLALLLVLVVLASIFIGKKVHFPLPYMLGPLLTAAAFNVSGIGAPTIPGFWLNLAQLMLGAHLGYTLKVNKPQLFKKMFGVIVVSNALLIGFCYLLSLVLQNFIPFPLAEIFLSIAPGGVTEMAVTAMAVNVDVSMVTSFHLFRILFILFLLSPVMKWSVGRRAVP